MRNNNKKTQRSPRRIEVRAIRRNPPDLRKLSRALIAAAMANAQAEADAQAEHEAAAKNKRKVAQ